MEDPRQPPEVTAEVKQAANECAIRPQLLLSSVLLFYQTSEQPR